MATKSGQPEPERAEVIEEMLDALDTTLDRVKVLYEQYFLGIQKQPPTYLHTDIERKIRDLAQIQIRNTALRYRFVTLQQKFGSYNSYWRRTLRQIENGTYARNLFKIGRQAVKTGASVPEEILAAMPKRMRDQVIRDREAALALARLRVRHTQDDDLLTLADEDLEIDVGDLAADDLDPVAFIHESTDLRRNALTAAGAHRVDDADSEFDVDAFFASVIQDDQAPSLASVHDAAAPGRETAPPLVAPEARRSARSSRHGSVPPGAPADAPVVARTRTGHPRPSSASGTPVAALPATLSSPGSGSGADPAQSARGTGQTRTAPARVASEPGSRVEPVPAARATGAARTMTPGAGTHEEPGAEPVPAVKATGPARTVTPGAGTHEEPGAEPVPAARATGAARTVSPRAGTHEEPGGEALARARAASRSAADEGQAATGAPIEASPPGRQGGAAAPARVPGGSERTPPPLPRVPKPVPSIPEPSRPLAPSQATTPLRVMPGAAAAFAPTPVDTLTGPFPRIPSPPPPAARAAQATSPRGPDPSGAPAVGRAASPAPDPATGSVPSTRGAPERADVKPPASRPPPPPAPRASPPPVPASRPASPRPAPERGTREPRQAPPPGMSDADVNALYAKYVKAKQILGEEAEPGTYGKLLKTINAQAPKIMEQYKSKGVDFSVVVKDNQVIIRAKPKP